MLDLGDSAAGAATADRPSHHFRLTLRRFPLNRQFRPSLHFHWSRCCRSTQLLPKNCWSSFHHRRPSPSTTPRH